MLQTHKWRRPKWVKFPRSMLDDARWIGLGPDARSTWMSILVIASENPNSELPAPAVLFRRLRALGNCSQLSKFDRIIDELIQCGFLLKTSPELQSYRVSELQSPLLRNADLTVGHEEIRTEEVGEEARNGESRDHRSATFAQARRHYGERGASLVGRALSSGAPVDEVAFELAESIRTENDLGEVLGTLGSLGQPQRQWSTPRIEEVTNPLEASLIRLGCARRSGNVPRSN